MGVGFGLVLFLELVCWGVVFCRHNSGRSNALKDAAQKDSVHHAGGVVFGCGVWSRLGGCAGGCWGLVWL